MKKLGFLMLLLAIALASGGTVIAQDTSVYFTTYYSSANTAGAPDATVRIINDGYQDENLFANIYVFDDSEELTECCTCTVTPDGILSESVNLNLTANPLTGHKPTRGVIKVVSTGYFFIIPVPVPLSGLRVWATHVEGTKVALSPGNPIVPTITGPYFVTETPAADSNLGSFFPPSGEQLLLRNLCMYDSMLSGQPCTCQPEDFDF